MEDVYYHILIHQDIRQSLQSEHSSSGSYLSRAHCGDYLHLQGTSVIPYLYDWLVHHPDHQVLLCHQSQLLKCLEMVGFKLNTKKSVLDLVQDIKFLGIPFTSGSMKTFTPRIQGYKIDTLSSQPVLSFQQVPQFMGSLSWASGLIPLGHLHLRPLQQHFHALGLTNRFTPVCQSDQSFLATLLRHWPDPFFLPLASLSDHSRRTLRYL